ncbi:MAG TPA: hypothetical protein VMY37_23595 [Thermoguttaceae bacterium]|nr:hypothetical protein [Thermoguttaceae bacterium]
MNIAALKAELLAGHPGTGAYDDDAAVAAGQLNAVNRTRNRASMTGSEIINAVVPSEWNALTDAERQTVWNILHLGDVNPFGVEATLLTSTFGAGSATITALAAARKDDVSRADELGLGTVYPGHVENARM